MNIFTDNSVIKHDENTVVTLGTFDGIHKGHINILNKVIDLSAKNNCRSFVITFEPHPRTVLSKNYDMKILTTLKEKQNILRGLGIENLMIVNFTNEFSQVDAENFVKDFIVNKIGVKHVVIGHDHKFGKNREGDENKLKGMSSKYGFDVTAVNAVNNGGEVVSSTKVRNALVEGDISKANDYLGRNYHFNGKIVEGAKRGSQLGFPTANIEIDHPKKLIPENGVYTVKCHLKEGTYFGMMNIGIRPTFENSLGLVIEVHVFDFNKDVYGEEIKVELLERIRPEKKFASKDELVNQMESDKKESLKFIDSFN